MSEYAWTDDMREISGFAKGGDPIGNGYEEGCRRMVSAGAKFWAMRDAEGATDSDGAPVKFDPHFHDYQGVTGIIVEDDDDARALVRAMLDAPFTDRRDATITTVGQYGATGAMVQFCVSHVQEAHRLGWAGYQAEMRRRKS
jgi:hypothetical protein